MAEVPWKKDTMPAYQKQERRPIAGTQKEPNSGRRWNRQGDRSMRQFVTSLLIDNKTTDFDSYRVVGPKWKAWERAAQRNEGCEPAWQVDMADEISIMIVNLTTWDYLLNYALGLETEVARLRKALQEMKDDGA